MYVILCLGKVHLYWVDDARSAEDEKAPNAVHVCRTAESGSSPYMPHQLNKQRPYARKGKHALTHDYPISHTRVTHLRRV